jgi:hypothetical protein
MTKMNQSCVLSMSLVMTGAALAMSLVACSAGPVVTTTESGPDAGPFNKDNKDSGPSSSPVGKLCNKASDCSTGLNCQKATVGTDGVCTTGCTTNADCNGGAQCISGKSIGLAPSCVPGCTTPNDCSAGMDCFKIDGASSVCLPKDWATPKANKGIGDSCTSDADCTVGQCTGANGATGWCTHTCSGDSNVSCPGSHNGLNENGQQNWCILASNSSYSCFPGCDTSSAACSDFPGTTCQGAKTYFGNNKYICSK